MTNFGTIIGAGGNAFAATEAGVTLANYGALVNGSTVHPAVYFGAGGNVINGSTSATKATIDSQSASGVIFDNSAGTIVNFGTIESTTSGTSGEAIFLGAGGTITNYGLISGVHRPAAGSYGGVIITHDQYATIRNFGTISPTNIGDGINLDHGGTIVNGATNATGALISGSQAGIDGGGYNGVAYGAGAAGQIVNFGTIESTTSGTSGEAIFLGAGGTITNYGLISGVHRPAAGSYGGVIITHDQYATIRNFGTISPTNIGDGINLDHGGTIVNGATNATGALISGSQAGIDGGGYNGVAYGAGAAGQIINYGTIQATGTAPAIRLVSGGTVTNRGLIASDQSGVSFHDAAGTVVNFGSIVSTPTGTSGSGIYLQSGGRITNQAGASVTAVRDAVTLGGTVTTSASALATNYGVLSGNLGISVGVDDTGGNTINNYGTITGTGGTAVVFGAGNGELVNESGGVINGRIEGGAGNDTFEFTAAGLTASDTIVGGGGTDSLVFTTAGTIAASVFDHISGIGTIKLANGTDDVSLTNVGSAPDKTETVVGGTGDDTISSADVGAGTTVIFEFTTAQLTTNDKLTGGAGDNIVRFTTAGTTGVAAFTHVSNIGTIELANGTDNVTLTNVAAAPDKTETVVGGTGKDTISAANEGAGTTVIFEFTTAQLTTNDKLTGGAGDNIVRFTTAGTIAVSVFDHISGVGTIDLANGTNNLSLANVASAPDKSETVQGGTGNDTINAAGVGAGNTVTFNGGGGNDTITGSQGDNIYQFDNTPGTLGITNSFSSGTAAHGELDFGPGLSDQSIWFLQSGNNLVAEVIGTTEKVTINGWFGSNASAKVAEIKADGLELDSKVSNLVSAMATYSASHPAFNPTAPSTTIPDDPALQTAITASWHT